MSEPNTITRWKGAEQNRDQLQAQLDALDAGDRAGLARDDGERERVEHAITVADDEIEAAEIAFHRALGDHVRVTELESDRMHAELAATEAAHELLAYLRRDHGEDDLR